MGKVSNDKIDGQREREEQQESFEAADPEVAIAKEAHSEGDDPCGHWHTRGVEAYGVVACAHIFGANGEASTFEETLDFRANHVGHGEDGLVGFGVIEAPEGGERKQERKNQKEPERASVLHSFTLGVRCPEGHWHLVRTILSALSVENRICFIVSLQRVPFGTLREGSDRFFCVANRYNRTGSCCLESPNDYWRAQGS